VVLESSALEFQYRRSNLPADLVIVSAELTLETRPGQAIRAEMEEYRQRRRHQPLGQKSAGSVFKNPPEGPAGRLIEQAGCKGLRVDGAEVSPQHANFIVNCGGASAAAVRDLIAMVRQRVKERFDILLELEIIQVGEE
jgi:UDP-N-acetylmuramate dehydrogenase